MLEREEQQRLIKKVKVNYLTNNLAEFNFSNLTHHSIVWTFLFFNFYFIFINFVIYQENYIIVLDNLEMIHKTFLVWFMTSVISAINNLNYINDFLPTTFNFSIEVKELNLNSNFWILLVSSFLSSLLLLILDIIQYLKQQDLNTSGINWEYVPYIFLFNKKVYTRNIRGMKTQNTTREQKERLIELFFKINKENVKDFEILEHNKKFLKFYDYKHYTIKKIEKKERTK